MIKQTFSDQAENTVDLAACLSYDNRKILKNDQVIAQVTKGFKSKTASFNLHITIYFYKT